MILLFTAFFHLNVYKLITSYYECVLDVVMACSNYKLRRDRSNKPRDLRLWEPELSFEPLAITWLPILKYFPVIRKFVQKVTIFMEMCMKRKCLYSWLGQCEIYPCRPYYYQLIRSPKSNLQHFQECSCQNHISIYI